ncbi:MAG: sigma-54 dependent transcriptional regulator [Vicinamibacterales bacterium]
MPHHATAHQGSVIIGESAPMRAVAEQIRVCAQSASTVVITGESGTGKELTALAIHEASSRRLGPFVPVSCVLFNDTLIESELFGHERGAFTGAIRERAGRFESARGGTVFLDDIDDVPLAVQVKLLRVLQNRTVERLGATRPTPVDVRIIAGSKRDLGQMVQDGLFREDLFYRLNVLTLTLPPLRTRTGDIPPLIEHFVARFAAMRSKSAPRLDPEVASLLSGHDWRGNVRELENACERLVQTCACTTICRDCPSLPMLAHQAPAPRACGPATATREEATVHLDDELRALERRLIEWALTSAAGNRSKAAHLLHIKRSTLCDRMQRHGLLWPPAASGAQDAARGTPPSSRRLSAVGLARGTVNDSAG